MALFKIFKGLAADLPQKKTEGYAYFTTDSGMLYIDVSADTRVQVNARGAEALMVPKTEGGGYNYIDADQFVTIDDVIDVQHGGTGASTLTVNALLIGNGTNTLKMITIPNGSFVVGDTTNGVAAKTPAEARTLLDTYNKTETDNKVAAATTLSYTTTLTVAGWQQSGSEWSQKYTQAALTCGKNGNVPPIVSFTDNQDEYSKIDRAEATPGDGIVFYIKERPTENIPIVIIDVK